MLDVILYVEVDSDISSDTSRPAFPDVGFGNLDNGKGCDRLSHPGPAPEHHSTILWLPVQKDRHASKLEEHCGLLSRLKISWI